MLKAMVRQFVAKDQWEFMSWFRTRFGLVPALGAYARMRNGHNVALVPNKLAGGNLHLRPGTADLDVYDEIFGAMEYAIDLGEPRFIVDAGAHIGLSSVYFASRFPNAIVVAIEPEAANYEILLLNVRGYSNIKPINAGLWSKRTQLMIQDSNAANWGFRVTECPSGAGIPAIGIDDVISDFGISQIDVLKIDIEGSEVEVLRNCHAWIDRVRTVIIELHDRFQPGCTEALDFALQGHAYQRSMAGEKVLITSLRRSDE